MTKTAMLPVLLLLLASTLVLASHGPVEFETGTRNDPVAREGTNTPAESVGDFVPSTFELRGQVQPIENFGSNSKWQFIGEEYKWPIPNGQFNYAVSTTAQFGFTEGMKQSAKHLGYVKLQVAMCYQDSTDSSMGPTNPILVTVGTADPYPSQELVTLTTLFTISNPNEKRMFTFGMCVKPVSSYSPSGSPLTWLDNNGRVNGYMQQQA